METSDRIAQWENMTQADPTNDMAWFSLGSAYRDLERHEESAAALAKAIQLNPGMSRAYQLRAQVLIKLNRLEEAAEVLTRGYVVAADRGDVMPQRAMESLLQKLGKPVPAVAQKPVDPAVASGQKIVDRRSGDLGTRLPDPPLRGPLGRFIYDHYTQETWRAWIGQGTKLINELRLDLSRPEHQTIYQQQMMEWLGITPEDLQAADPGPGPSGKG